MLAWLCRESQFGPPESMRSDLSLNRSRIDCQTALAPFNTPPPISDHAMGKPADAVTYPRWLDALPTKAGAMEPFGIPHCGCRCRSCEPPCMKAAVICPIA